MGFFIIGVLAGWLAEWVFFTFFIKGNQDASRGADASALSALQAELNAKNKQIQELQAKIADSGAAGSSDVSSSSESNVTTKSTTKKTSAASEAGAVSKGKTTAQTQEKKAKSATKTKPSSAKPAAKKSAVSKKASAPAGKSSTKPGAKKTTSGQSKAATTKPKKKAATTTTTTNTTKNKKAPTTKATKAKATPKKTKTRTSGDDFTKLSGIGPSMAATLNELGIDTYKKLAAMDDDILRDMLEASGARLNNNKEAMDSWNEQALLADKGDFEGLKKLQESLKK